MYKFSDDSKDFLGSLPSILPDFRSKGCKVITENPSLSIKYGKPASWRDLEIVVILHCHYLSRLNTFDQYLNLIPQYDLLVTVTDKFSENLIKRWAEKLRPNLYGDRNIIIRCVSNCGRDVKPFWEAGIQVANDYKIFLKIHTKSSPHYQRPLLNLSDKGTRWLHDIMSNLMPSESQIFMIATLIEQGTYGAVFPVPWYRFRGMGWTNKANLLYAQHICTLLSIDQSILFAPLQYPVGNMYWGSTSLLSSYAAKVISSFDWPNEPVDNDGTLLHAFERMSGHLYTSLGKKIAYSSSSLSTPLGEGLFSWDFRDFCDNSASNNYLPKGKFLDVDNSQQCLPTPLESLALISFALSATAFPSRRIVVLFWRFIVSPLKSIKSRILDKLSS